LRGDGDWGRVARQIGSQVALGLEAFIVANILNFILKPAWTAVATLAYTVVIVRKLITLSLQGATRRS
jgi:uncharacterized membrane protein